MFIMGLLQWWYGAGWKRQMVTLNVRLAGVYDYFSIGLLVRSLFSPFRQISAGSVDGPLSVKWHAFLDRTVSRVVGAVMRTVIMIVGILAIVLTSLLSLIALLLWPFLPLAPAIGIALAIVGWVPWKI